MKKKYEVQITGNLNGNTITMSVPVELNLNEQVANEAVLEARHQGIENVKVQTVKIVDSEDLVQIPMPFEEDSAEDTEDAEDVSSGSYTPYRSEAPREDLDDSASSEYTPYSSVQTDCVNDNSFDETQQFDDATSTYTPYASLLKNNKNKAISFVPKIKGSYVPYKTNIVPIPGKYLNFNFE